MHIRPPTATDGAAVHALIARCPPLDGNSLYCNLLQCTHFTETSALAEKGDALVGFVSGYRLPDEPGALFVWQVAVDPAARGQGLGERLIRAILARPACAGVTVLKATVTRTNGASRAMFERLAGRLGAAHKRTLLFDRERHLAGAHDSEYLMTIGPFAALGPRSTQQKGRS
ncbi:MAG: diaminobutyrate acetyltransferase [Alphaproteobacteria bacterium]|nr:MAG: diaminobutyrate acetyltransferase [Alphaproteobacteria bacterium]